MNAIKVSINNKIYRERHLGKRVKLDQLTAGDMISQAVSIKSS